MMKKNNLHILFDLDGTIGDTLPLCIAAFREAIEPCLGVKLSDKDITDHFGPSEEGTIMALVPDHYDDAFNKFIDTYKRMHVDFPNPFARIPEILKFLNKNDFHIGMVTGKGKVSTKITLDQYGLADCFDYIKTGSKKGPVKKERFEEILSETGLSPNHFIYIGDTIADIVACKSVGIRIVSAAWADTSDANELKAESPDDLFESITDFEEFIRAL